MVSAPPRSPVSSSAGARPGIAPVRVPLPDGALTWDDFLKLGEDNPGHRFERYTASSGWGGSKSPRALSGFLTRC